MVLDCLRAVEADGFRIDFATDYDGQVESMDLGRPNDRGEWAELDMDAKTFAIRRPVPPARPSGRGPYPSFEPAELEQVAKWGVLEVFTADSGSYIY